MSRNKREGQYAGQWKEPLIGKVRKHHRLYHHKKPPAFKSVGQLLLIAVF